MMKKIVIIVAALFCMTALEAKVVLPSIFGDNMVLQQKADVRIWGKADGQTVTVSPSWGGQYSAKTAADGSWLVVMPSPAASYQTYDITISDGQPVTLSNVQVGEVWFCSGQSNMEMWLGGQSIIGGLDAVLDSNNQNLRIFAVEKKSTVVPQTDCTGHWGESSPETTNEFSAAAYFFGRQLQKVLGVPVGLIGCSWSGSNIEAWMPEEVLAAFPEVKIPKSDAEVDPRRPNTTPTLLYNGMLKPILGYTIAGCIWYQGESNKDQPAMYERLFAAMVANWRATWHSGDFGFYFAQIAPFEYGGGLNSAFMREAQMNCMKNIPNTGMAVLMDVGDQFDIHPRDKRTVGIRLACSALAQTYGVKGVPFSGPIYKSMAIGEDGITVTFDYADQLTATEKPITGFEIAGEDRVFHPANVVSGNQNTLLIASPDVPKPVAVRYCFKDYEKGILYNGRGLPVSSFRTDNWAE